jgi:hypothetical protein
MKKFALMAAAATLCFAGGIAVAEVHDWPDLASAHQHVKSAIGEMARARAANHYDMEGHGARAEQLLRDAERELAMARHVAAMR